MNVDTVIRREYEQTLINIARGLPSTQVEQLVDFARFLEAQMLNEALLKGEDATQVEADEERWDELLATDEAQLLLEKMANEALAEHCAGQTKPLAFVGAQSTGSGTQLQAGG
jgi:hypothetical protein